MPKKAKKRKPGELVLATFIIPHEKWQDFQNRAKAEGRTASAILVAFIERYLGGKQSFDLELESQLEADFDTTLDERIEAIASVKIANLGELLNQLDHTVKYLDKRLSKLESAAHKSETENFYSANFIDVEVIAINDNFDENANINIEPEKPDNEPNLEDLSGLTQKALCEEFGINPSNIIRNAKVRGLSSPEYLQQVTGWVYRNGKYYPPDK